MTEVADNAYWGPSAVHIFIGVLIIHVCSWALLLNYLRQRYPEIWTQLGSPTLWLNSSILNRWRTDWFLISGKYRSLKDPTLNWLGSLTLLFGAGIPAVGIYIILTGHH
jgi:hypothetical protein